MSLPSNTATSAPIECDFLVCIYQPTNLDFPTGYYCFRVGTPAGPLLPGTSVDVLDSLPAFLRVRRTIYENNTRTLKDICDASQLQVFTADGTRQILGGAVPESSEAAPLIVCVPAPAPAVPACAVPACAVPACAVPAPAVPACAVPAPAIPVIIAKTRSYAPDTDTVLFFLHICQQRSDTHHTHSPCLSSRAPFLFRTPKHFRLCRLSTSRFHSFSIANFFLSVLNQKYIYDSERRMRPGRPNVFRRRACLYFGICHLAPRQNCSFLYMAEKNSLTQHNTQDEQQPYVRVIDAAKHHPTLDFAALLHQMNSEAQDAASKVTSFFCLDVHVHTFKNEPALVLIFL
jgi:hypothetical protein